jgi:flagellar hook-length control protein FliK
MTTVATISASTAADAAVFAGPARSTDSSGQFATELNKTTQQVRERQDGQQPAHSNRSVDRQDDRQNDRHVDRAVDKNAINSEPTSADNDQRIRTPKSESDQSVTENQIVELADPEATEDLEADSIGIAVAVPVVAEPVITDPVNSDGIDLAELDLAVSDLVVNDLGEISPTDIDLSVAVSAASGEGLATAALGAVVPTPAGITPASASTDASPTASIEVPTNVTGQMNSGQLSPDQAPLNTSLSATENLAQTDGVETDGVETVGLETGTTATDTDEAVNNPRGISSANSLAADSVATDSTATDSTDAQSGVNNNVGTMPVSNTKNINSPIADGAETETPDIAPQPTGLQLPDSQSEVTTNAPAGVDGEGAEVPNGSNPAVSSLTNSASTDAESESGSTPQSNSGSSAGSSNEQAMGMDRATRVEDAPTDRVSGDRVQGLETRASLDASGSPIVTNQASTSVASSVTLGTGSALPTAEPKAPAPAPVSTQMSAHLSTFKGLADGTYETTLRLYPEELGQVSVRIQVNGGTVSIHAFGASDMAVQALREAMPDLRQDLLRSGLDLVDSQVDQGSAFLGNEQESSSGRMADSDNPDRPVSQRNGDVSGADIEILTSIDPSRGGRVDVRV